MSGWIYLIIFCGAAYWWYKKNEAKQLSEDNIIDRWSSLIEGAQGKGPAVFSKVQKRIETLEAPNLHIAEQKMTSGGMIGRQKRVYLMAKNKRLKGYYMYVGAMDYGKQLFVSWYLVQEPTGLMRFIKIITSTALTSVIFLPFTISGIALEKFQGKVSPINLDVFDMEELTAYVTTGHHAVMDSVEALMGEFNQDFTKVETRSRGFLNIS
jgi:hypothetical protein